MAFFGGGLVRSMASYDSTFFSKRLPVAVIGSFVCAWTAMTSASKNSKYSKYSRRQSFECKPRVVRPRVIEVSDESASFSGSRNGLSRGKPAEFGIHQVLKYSSAANCS